MLPTRFLRFAASSSSSSVPPTLKVGHVLKQIQRFAEADVVRFSAVSGDCNPIHLDADFSRRIGGFDRGAIVHGMLVASLFPSIIASNFPGAVYTSQTLQFKSPVYIGDEVIAEVEAVTIRAIKEKYYVKWLTKCYIGKESVIDGEATSILRAITLNECHN